MSVILGIFRFGIFFAGRDSDRKQIKKGKEEEKMTVKTQNIKEQIEQLNSHKTAGNRAAFNKVLFEFMPHFRKVIHHKIRQMELRGELPKNMYSAQGVVDEVYLRIFNESSNKSLDENYLKAKMFIVAKEILAELKEKESGHKQAISMETLIGREMQALEEDYTLDAEGELVLLEELDDISYHQEEYGDNLILIEEAKIDEIARVMELKGGSEPLTDEERKRIGKVYSDLPETSRAIVEYISFGKLSHAEVATVLNLSTENITRMVSRIRARFLSVLRK